MGTFDIYILWNFRTFLGMSLIFKVFFFFSFFLQTLLQSEDTERDEWIYYFQDSMFESAEFQGGMEPTKYDQLGYVGMFTKILNFYYSGVQLKACACTYNYVHMKPLHGQFMKQSEYFCW